MRDEEEDEVEKVGTGSMAALLYRIFPTILHSRVFLGTVPTICAASISSMRQMGCYLGFYATAAHGAHLSLPSVAPH